MADENNIPFLASALTFDALLAAVPFFLLILAGLGAVLERSGGAPIDSTQLFERFLPPHVTVSGQDPFEAVERMLARLTEVGQHLSVYALPAFLWFSTRLFAGIRISLNHIYDVSVRPVRQHFLVGYVRGKLRDLRMVTLTVVLFLGHTALSAGLAVLQVRGREAAPRFSFFFTTVGRWLTELLAFGFLVSLFFVIYYFASMRRPPWRAGLVASLFSAVAFEGAKRLFGLYVRNVISFERSAVDVNLGAVILFILWMYYSALVFLLGGVLAETWELRDLQRKQRAKLGDS